MQPNSIKFIVICVIITKVYAAPIDDYNEGKKLAERLQSGIQQPANAKAAHPVPNYIREPEKTSRWQHNQNLNDKDLNGAATNQLATEKVARTIVDINNQRPRIQQLMDSQLIKRGLLLESRAQEILAIKGKAFVEKTNKITKVECEASRNAEKFQCIRYLKLPTVTITPEVRSQRLCSRCGGHKHRVGDREYGWDTSIYYCGSGDNCACDKAEHYYVTHVVPRKVDVTSDEWVSDCQHLEARIKKNECKLIKTECLDKEPKTIEGETITRECWKYQDTYSCQYPCFNNCGPYLAKGCRHIGSECKFKVQDKCYIWQQRLECPEQVTEKVTDVTNAKWFGLNGECGAALFEPNNEFASSIAELSIFGAMQKEIEGGINNLFKGQNNQCRKTGFGVKDCCEKLGGWGVNFKLTDCNEEEQLLAGKRAHNLCHEVGTYKTSKELLVIPKQKTSFCCFPSKLARILHEQGRGQLGIEWGEPEYPNCRGFTVEELSRLNFERMNLSELFADVMQKVKPVDVNKLNLQIQDKFKLLQQGTVKQEDRHDA